MTRLLPDLRFSVRTLRKRPAFTLGATGALMLVGVAIGLLRLRRPPHLLPVGDLLPALVVAPLLTELVVLLR